MFVCFVQKSQILVKSHSFISITSIHQIEMSARNLRSLGRFLTTLGLDTDKVPSVSEYRRAYRSLLHLHPDKAGDDTLSRFQEITEAAKEVFEFLTTNGNLKPEDISVDDIFGIFVQNNNLQLQNHEQHPHVSLFQRSKKT